MVKIGKGFDADHVVYLDVGDKTFRSRLEECNMCKGTGEFEDFPECPFCDGTGIHVAWERCGPPAMVERGEVPMTPKEVSTKFINLQKRAKALGIDLWMTGGYYRLSGIRRGKHAQGTFSSLSKVERQIAFEESIEKMERGGKCR
jgi:RecJ-like exonuclease